MELRNNVHGPCRFTRRRDSTAGARSAKTSPGEPVAAGCPPTQHSRGSQGAQAGAMSHPHGARRSPVRLPLRLHACRIEARARSRRLPRSRQQQLVSAVIGRGAVGTPFRRVHRAEATPTQAPGSPPPREYVHVRTAGCPAAQPVRALRAGCRAPTRCRAPVRSCSNRVGRDAHEFVVAPDHHGHAGPPTREPPGPGRPDRHHAVDRRRERHVDRGAHRRAVTC